MLVTESVECFMGNKQESKKKSAELGVRVIALEEASPVGGI